MRAVANRQAPAAPLHAGLGVALALLLGGCAALQPSPSRSTPENQTLNAIGRTLEQETPLPAAPIEVPKAVRDALGDAGARISAPKDWLPEPRFDLSVSNAPAAQVFLALATDTRYSMLLPPDLPGRVTINLKDVTMREALEALRELYGYEYRIEGKRVYVMPQSLQTRVFQINYLAVARKGQSDIRVSTGSLTANAAPAPGSDAAATPGTDGRGIEASRLVTQTEANFWPGVTAALQAIVGEAGGHSVVINPLAGVVVVRATPSVIRQVEAYLRATQIAVERQVMLEAKIVEVQLRDGYQTGINWAAFNTLGQHRASLGADTGNVGVDRASSGTLAQLLGSGVAGATGRTAEGLFSLAFQTSSFQALIQFLESQGTVHVLSSPRIATLNNQKAVLKVGTDDFFVTNVTTSTVTSGNSATSSPTITVQPFFSGIALDVTPQIDDRNNILLHVHPSISVVTERNKDINLGTLGNYTLPLASSSISETDSVVRIPNGNIVAIGGLMTQEQRDSGAKVPGLGDVPVLGALFGNRDRSFSKRELVILIKPTVIRNERDWAEDLGSTRDRVSGYGADQRRPVATR
ncbi:MAG: pilus (MSHA type) biogenesis protein MshL [Burkholderiales bacterium]|nr:MAG: pilus (MSHA type) biogenesis protein MshL [Burkholderiales bacterium]